MIDNQLEIRNKQAKIEIVKGSIPLPPGQIILPF
jgi:hypothetical protein